MQHIIFCVCQSQALHHKTVQLFIERHELMAQAKQVCDSVDETNLRQERKGTQWLIENCSQKSVLDRCDELMNLTTSFLGHHGESVLRALANVAVHVGELRTECAAQRVQARFIICRFFLVDAFASLFQNALDC